MQGSVLDLGKILDRNFTEEEIAIIINDILHGLIYMHQLNIVNRNIQINNIPNTNTNQTLFHDFFSEPNNPEDLFTPLFTIYKSDKTEIFKAIYNETREIFCLKKIDSKNFFNEKKISKNFYNQIKEETSLMKCLKNNENILQYHGSFFFF